MPQRSSVVITGASAGVGRATARAFAAKGWNVALLARGKAGLDGAARDVRRAGGTPLVIPTDVAQAEQVFAAAQQVADTWGHIDVWINNAMVTVFAPVDQITPEEFARVTHVTYLGQVHGTMAALRHMRKTDRGTIVQIGSALSYRAIPLQSAYCGAKAASRVFTDALRSELLHDGSHIRVTTVHLPAVNTPQFDWGRTRMDGPPQPVPPIHAPDSVARVIVKAARDCPREVWVGWPTLQTIVGNLAAPGLMDRLMAERAYDSQVGSAEHDTERPDNLFDPVERDMGAEGRFADRSTDKVMAFPGPAVRAGVIMAGIGATAGLTLLLAASVIRQRR